MPYDEGFIEGVETVAGRAVEGLQRKRLLVAFRVGEGERQGMGDVPGFFKASDNIGDEVFGNRLGGVGEDDVGVTAVSFTAAIAADYDAF